MPASPRSPCPYAWWQDHAARLDKLQLRVLDDLRRQHRRGDNRHDLVVVAVQDQCRHIELLQVLGQIGFGERLDADIGRPACRPSCSAARTTRARLAKPSRPDGCRRKTASLRSFRTANGPRARWRECRSNTSIGVPPGLAVRLQHDGRHRADQHGLRDAARAVPADVARDFAAAGRMADVNRSCQIELRRRARRDRRRTYPCHCRARAGSNGRDRADHGRCSDSHAAARKNIWSSQASALAASRG